MYSKLFLLECDPKDVFSLCNTTRLISSVSIFYGILITALGCYSVVWNKNLCRDWKPHASGSWKSSSIIQTKADFKFNMSVHNL